jgi:excisionase family DNA binding protein
MNAGKERGIGGLLHVSEVAEILSVSESAVYRWVDQGRLPFLDLGRDGHRRCLRFRPEDIERFILSKRNWDDDISYSSDRHERHGG